MMRSVSMAPLGSEFEDFLYAPLGQDNDGMTLTVLSALARLNVDPWEEAARLARLSEETAVEQLISLLDAVPRGVLACQDSAARHRARVSVHYVFRSYDPSRAKPSRLRRPAADSSTS